MEILSIGVFERTDSSNATSKENFGSGISCLVGVGVKVESYRIDVSVLPCFLVEAAMLGSLDGFSPDVDVLDVN